MKVVLPWFLAGAFVALFSVTRPARVFAAVSFAQTGMNSGDDWTPDRTGTQLVTVEAQGAVDWCRNNKVTLCVPPGTFLVHGTITIKTDDGISGKGTVTFIHQMNLNMGRDVGFGFKAGAEAPVLEIVHC